MTTTRMCPVRLPRSSRSSEALNLEARSLSRNVALNVLVPMGGLQTNAYVESGYRLPKPMIPIVGRPMLLWMFDNLELQDGDHVWLGLRRDLEQKFSISSLLKREHPKLEVHVVCFDFETRGVTETLYCILNAMDAESRTRRTISLDSDTLWFCDVLGGARALPADVGASFYFNDTSDDANAPYSYIRVDRKSKIVDIREKVAISRLANNGAYVFESGDAALSGLESLLDEACLESKHQNSSMTEQASSTNFEDDLVSPGDTLSIDGSVQAMHLDDSERQKYVSGLIEHMMRRKAKTFLAVLANDFANLGTPAKLRSFIARLRRGEVVGARAMRFCFGLDGTLLTADDPVTSSSSSSSQRKTQDFSTCKPIDKNIAIARELHEAGHTIIVWTDRGMSEAGGSAARAMAEIGRLTFEQLESFGIPHDEVVFGKPHADVYVDARAVNPLLGDKFEDALGWDLVGGDGTKNSDLDSGVAPRHFNSIRRIGDDHVEKTGPRSVLRGEIFWYQHVPPDLADLFPAASAVREHPAQELSSVVLARVTGVTFSHLVVNSCLTPGRLTLLLNSLNRLHTCQSVSNGAAAESTTTAPPPPPPATPPVASGAALEDVSDEMLCQNYYAKVSKRFAKHQAFFKTFDDQDIDTGNMAKVVLEELRLFEREKRFKKAHFIHGDPVFSNVMLTTDSHVKFLDMRGALGDVLTTAGDLCYDLSKTFQSLCGYDFIILDVPRSSTADAVLEHLRTNVFGAWLQHHHPDVSLRTIKILTAAHFFCIVPLHENRTHQRAFLLASLVLLHDVGLC